YLLSSDFLSELKFSGKRAFARRVSKQACGDGGGGLRCVSPAVLHEGASTDTTVPFWIWQGLSGGLHSKPGLIHSGVLAVMAIGFEEAVCGAIRNRRPPRAVRFRNSSRRSRVLSRGRQQFRGQTHRLFLGGKKQWPRAI